MIKREWETSPVDGVNERDSLSKKVSKNSGVMLRCVSLSMIDSGKENASHNFVAFYLTLDIPF